MECRNQLLAEFHDSSYARDVEEVDAISLVMEWAEDYFAETIVTLKPRELREIVFETIPRKLSAPSTDAPLIIDELRAFYRFLEARYQDANAAACLAVLGEDGADELEAAMADPRNFGMAKSMVMGTPGHAIPRPFNPWDGGVAGEFAPPPAPVSHTPAISRKAAKAKKDKQKAARKARRKNR